MQNSRMSTGKPAAKARPKQASAPSSSSFATGIPSHSRKWIDVESGEQHARSYPIAKRMNTLLRPEPLLWDEDGAIDFGKLKMQLESGCPNSVHWSVRSWINHLQRGGGEKNIFQYFMDSTGEEILYLRAIQGHSRENPVDPSLQDNVLIPNDPLQVHQSCWVLHQYALYHCFRIDSGSNKMPSGNDKRYSLQPWILRQCVVTRRKNSIWLSPDLLLTSKNGRYTKMHCIGSTSGSLRERDWSFSKRGQTQSFSMIFSHQSVLKEWCPQRHKKSCTQKLVGRHLLCQRLPLKTIGKMIGKLMQQHQTHPTETKRQISRCGRTRYRKGPCQVRPRRHTNTCRKRQRKV